MSNGADTINVMPHASQYPIFPCCQSLAAATTPHEKKSSHCIYCNNPTLYLLPANPIMLILLYFIFKYKLFVMFYIKSNLIKLTCLRLLISNNQQNYGFNIHY